MELAQLLKNGETLEVEFKASLNDTQLSEETVAFANGNGGTLLIGVDDDGIAVGADPRHGETTNPDKIAALVRNTTQPALNVEVSIDTVDGFDIIIVAVPQAQTVTGTVRGVYKRRVIGADGKPQSIPMSPNDIMTRASTLGEVDFSLTPLPEATIADDLDPAELDRFRTLANQNNDPVGQLADADLLRSLQFIDLNGQITIGAVLMFGRVESIGRWLPNYEIGYHELSNLELRSSRRWQAPIIKALLELEAWIGPRNPEEEVDIGLVRLPLPRFAPAAIRELLVNAMVHRNHRDIGTTLVEINDDGMAISNPGGFPQGININNLLRTPPKARNQALAEACKRAGLGERASRGINRAFEAQLRAGRPAPDFGNSTADSVVVRLRAVKADSELAALFAERRQAGERLSLDDLLALHEVRRESRLTTKRAAELFQVDAGEARSVLNRLAEAGLLEARGEGKGGTYHLAAAYYSRLGRPGEYLRTRGFDQIQQRAMIKTAIENNGPVSRKQVAELCQITPEAASALLRRMRDDGELTMTGDRRGARYHLAEAVDAAGEWRRWRRMMR